MMEKGDLILFSLTVLSYCFRSIENYPSSKGESHFTSQKRERERWANERTVRKNEKMENQSFEKKPFLKIFFNLFSI